MNKRIILTLYFMTMTMVCRANTLDQKQVIIDKSTAFLDELILYANQLITQKDYEAKTKLLHHIEKFKELKPALENYLILIEAGEERKEIERILNTDRPKSIKIDEIVLWKYRQKELQYYPLIYKFDLCFDLSRELTGFFKKEEDLELAINYFIGEDLLITIKAEVTQLKARLEEI